MTWLVLFYIFLTVNKSHEWYYNQQCVRLSCRTFQIPHPVCPFFKFNNKLSSVALKTKTLAARPTFKLKDFSVILSTFLTLSFSNSWRRHLNVCTSFIHKKKKCVIKLTLNTTVPLISNVLWLHCIPVHFLRLLWWISSCTTLYTTL